MAEDQRGETRPRPPTGALPIDQTQWSGEHDEIKRALDLQGKGKVVIDSVENAWAENRNGTWTNHGPTSNFMGSGKPKGRRGEDRKAGRRRN